MGICKGHDHKCDEPCIFTSSHFHIFTSSQFSHFHIFTFSHLHIFTSSHFHIFTSSNFHIFTFSHFQIFTFSNFHIRKLTPPSSSYNLDSLSPRPALLAAKDERYPPSRQVLWSLSLRCSSQRHRDEGHEECLQGAV